MVIELEVFKILFRKFPISKMIKIYNNHFTDSNIYMLTTQNINRIFSGKTPYELLQIFSNSIDINDRWFVKDAWRLDNHDDFYSYTDEGIRDFIEDFIVELYHDKYCWYLEINHLELEVNINELIIEKIINKFGLSVYDIAQYYVYDLKYWERDASNYYNLCKFRSLYINIKEQYAKYRIRYADIIRDEEDTDWLWHYQNELLIKGCITID